MNPREIEKIINSSNVTKTPGSDKIRLKELKKRKELLPIITDIINDSLLNGKVPDEMKVAIIRPIYKNKKHNDPTNYRPISILNTLEKILEKVVHTQITNHVVQNNIISSQQYGYQKGKSSEVCLDTFANYVNDLLNKKEHVLTLYVDFTKAFDVLLYRVIMKQLHQIGVRDVELKWFESYLTNRKAEVGVLGESSERKGWAYGVPQGSLIGPLMYILTTNVITQKLETNDSKIFMFADDTAVVVAGNDADEVRANLNKAIRELQKLTHDLGLTINCSKTKIMNIRSRGPSIISTSKFVFHNHLCLHRVNIAYCDCEDEILGVDEHKYLGIWIDSNFKFYNQIEHVANKVRAAGTILYKLKFGIPLKTLKMVYHALVESHFNYAITSWCREDNSYTRSLGKLQDKIITNMLSNKLNKKYSNINEKYKFLDLLPVQQLFKYKIIKKNYYKRDYQTEVNVNMYATRQENQIYFPTTANKYGDKLDKVLIPKIFNSLPANLKNIPKIGEAKKKIKKYLLHNL